MLQQQQRLLQRPAAASRRRLAAAAPAASVRAAAAARPAPAALPTSSAPQQQQQQQRPHQQPQPRRPLTACRASSGGGRGSGPSGGGGTAPATNLFSPVYLAIFAGYSALLLLHNPYIYAALTIAAVLPQNSAVTSLNNLVLLFYESGLFANFAEAVYCVRLVTWLSIGFMLGSFALFH
jgi:hypothetical protein